MWVRHCVHCLSVLQELLLADADRLRTLLSMPESASSKEHLHMQLSVVEERLGLLPSVQNQNEGEDGKCSEENISRMTYSSPVVQFVMEVLRQNGGSYGMAALSGLLKRNRPDLRELMGPIRKFVDQNFECFEIGKHPQSGAWVITLCDKMQDKQLDLSGSNCDIYELSEGL
mmetsp:Transcript_45478/g.86951  ORF Transcript_45478/g.86951 Transcript_45478/m.86951 type:complete len:172 (+) Transcript_45478:97-612(+)